MSPLNPPPAFDTDVLVVGGGLVGLSLSLLLHRQGVRHVVVEKHPGTSIHPKLRGLNTRTMEIYRELGLDDAIRAAGAPIAASHGIARARTFGEALDRAPRHGPDVASRVFAGTAVAALSPTSGARITQDLLEPVLLAAARERSCDVRFGVTCVDVIAEDDGVRAVVESGATNHERREIRAQYLVAADGAASPMRARLGATTSGAGSLGHLINVLVDVDLADRVRGREMSMCRIDNETVCGLFTSIDNARRWVFHLSLAPGESAAAYDAARLHDVVVAALGLDVPVRIVASSPWESAARVADRFRHGRVFLAGDAAHQMPPWGGFGGNTGVADAHNLAWKLAAVLHGADDALLDTYESERRPIAVACAARAAGSADERGLLRVSRFTAPVIGLVTRLASWGPAARVLTRLALPMLAAQGGLGFRYRDDDDDVKPARDDVPARDDGPVPVRDVKPTRALPDGSPGSRVPHGWLADGRSTLDVGGGGFYVLAGPDAVVDDDVRDLPYAETPSVPRGRFLLVRPDGVVASAVLRSLRVRSRSRS